MSLPNPMVHPMSNYVAERTLARKAYLHYIFTTAIEGGIDYWATAKEYVWQKPDNMGPSANATTLSEDHDNFYALLVPRDDQDGWLLADDTMAMIAATGNLQTQKGKQEIASNSDAAQFLPIRVDIEVIERGVTRFWEYCLGLRDICGRMEYHPDFNPEKANPVGEDHYWRQWMVQDITNGFDGDSDSDVCETIVQLGLFDEMIYA